MQAHDDIIDHAVLEFAVVTNRPLPLDQDRLAAYSAVWRRLVAAQRAPGVLVVEDFTQAFAGLLKEHRLLDISPVHVVAAASKIATARDEWARRLVWQVHNEPTMLCYAAADRFVAAALHAVANSTVSLADAGLVGYALTDPALQITSTPDRRDADIVDSST